MIKKFVKVIGMGSAICTSIYAAKYLSRQKFHQKSFNSIATNNTDVEYKQYIYSDKSDNIANLSSGDVKNIVKQIRSHNYAFSNNEIVIFVDKVIKNLIPINKNIIDGEIIKEYLKSGGSLKNVPEHLYHDELYKIVLFESNLDDPYNNQNFIETLNIAILNGYIKRSNLLLFDDYTMNGILRGLSVDALDLIFDEYPRIEFDYFGNNKDFYDKIYALIKKKGWKKSMYDLNRGVFTSEQIADLFPEYTFYVTSGVKPDVHTKRVRFCRDNELPFKFDEGCVCTPRGLNVYVIKLNKGLWKIHDSGTLELVMTNYDPYYNDYITIEKKIEGKVIEWYDSEEVQTHINDINTLYYGKCGNTKIEMFDYEMKKY